MASFVQSANHIALSAILLFLTLCSFVYGQWEINPYDLCQSQNPEHKCVMWGECHTVGQHRRACEYNGPAVRLFHNNITEKQKAEALHIIERRCPHILLDETGNRLEDKDIYTCCDYYQVLGIEVGAEMAAAALGRCPSCLRNFMRQICEMNCSPWQADFVSVESTPIDEYPSYSYITEVNYNINENFMEVAHASCSSVLIPQTGMPAIYLMCGNAPVCDAEAWFGFSGNISVNPFAPVQVNFLKTSDIENSMNIRALPCEEHYPTDLPCSCVDCFANCPVGLEPFIPDICTVLSVNCIGFSVGITFFVITVTIFSILTIIDYKRSRTNNKSKASVTVNTNKLVQFLEFIFSRVGGFCADNPVVIIMITTWIGIGMLYGALNINLTANPIELWSNPDSRTRQELDYFNTRFGPFYRPTQIYLEIIGLEGFQQNGVDYGPAFNLEAVKEAILLEEAIINIGRADSGVTVEHVCTAPMLERFQQPSVEYCVITSVGTYFGDNRYNIDESTYLTTIQNCINNHLSLNCMASWGGGAEPAMVFGGLKDNYVLSATTLVITIPLKNHLLQENLEPTLQWEQKFIDFMHEYEANSKPNWIRLAFAAERSIEDEIQRVSEAEIIPISISYILMFIYVTFALGHIKSWKTLFVESKMSVGFGSIVIVLLAILCAMGMMGYLGITTTLLAINVIPFFVLSIGIDNVFLLVNTLEEVNNNLNEDDDYNPNMSVRKRRRYVFQKMMKQAGPSIFITSATQITCFGIGTISNFPAVVTFAIFATFALVFLFIFQITTIVAILSIDYIRVAQQRLDVFCCVQKKIVDDDNPLTSGMPYKSITQRLMEPYSNFILHWKIKIIVAIIFMALVSISVILIPQIEIGLDQELALPQTSYVYSFLQAVNNLLSVGPPVFFVLTAGLNFTDPVHQNVICGSRLCNIDSLATQLFLASRHSNITLISQPSNSWLDDFFDWTTFRGSCCRFNIEDYSFCASTNTSEVCHFCTICLDDHKIRPLEDGFQRYIPFFLRDPPTDQCNRGGLASYSGSVNYLLESDGHATVQESNFMTFHTPLATSRDYIQAVQFAQEISANITEAIHKHTGVTDVTVFPYSVFYVFFEQYLTMWGDTFASIGFSLLAAFLINLVLSGFNLITTFVVTFTVILVVMNMMGLMYIWNIPLNAVSCVNLIVSIGIAVEFCNHTAFAFSTSTQPPRKKAKDALRRVGATIITGITFTNIPIIVLAFSYTELIEVFFFRMFFGLVIIGFLHGIVFLPVLLSFISNLMPEPRISSRL